MATFAQAIKNQEARTENGMKALASSANPCVDLFEKIGASRGKNIIPLFVAAYNHNREQAIRIAQWARDVRGGAGERELYRQILSWLEKNDQDSARALMMKTPLIGRFDDLLIFNEKDMRDAAFGFIKGELDRGNGLAAKWMPRKGPVAIELRSFLGLTPKQYRKTLVNLTKVVETQMCAKEWDAINFSHVPSVASARYRKAFYKRTTKYKEYVEALKTGKTIDGKAVKVNASAMFPYDVIKSRIGMYGAPPISATELDFIEQQWNALPNFVGDASVMPIVDVSGSMTSAINKTGLQALHIAVSLGLYFADKNKGNFKDVFMTFSNRPQLLQLTGNINQKIDQMVKSKWEMNTDLHAAFKLILDTAVRNSVPQNEMPETLLILSDMQFDQCARYDDSAIEMIRRKYTEAGYNMPKVVFWTLNAYSNTAVKFDERGTALVSGFSPAIAKSVLSNDLEDFTPENVMLKTIMVPRYDW